MPIYALLAHLFPRKIRYFKIDTLLLQKRTALEGTVCDSLCLGKNKG